MLHRVLHLVSRARHHVVVTVAILATLMTVFGVHPHQAAPVGSGEPCSGHHDSHASQHLVSTFSSGHTAPWVGPGDDGRAADGGCGSYCQMPGTTEMVLNPLLWFVDSGYTAVLRQSLDLAIPDSLSFKPDPPPIRG